MKLRTWSLAYGFEYINPDAGLTNRCIKQALIVFCVYQRMPADIFVWPTTSLELTSTNRPINSRVPSVHSYEFTYQCILEEKTEAIDLTHKQEYMYEICHTFGVMISSAGLFWLKRIS